MHTNAQRILDSQQLLGDQGFLMNAQDDRNANETDILQRGGKCQRRVIITDALGSSTISKEMGDCRGKGHREGGWSFSVERISSQVRTVLACFDPFESCGYENVLHNHYRKQNKRG